MSLRKSLAATGTKRAAGPAVRHWWYQRVSAVALIPLSLWFVCELSALASLDYATVYLWIAAPSTVILLLLFIPVLFYHAQAGMQVVIEDYAKTNWQTPMIILMRFLATVCALAAILAIMKICLGL